MVVLLLGLALSVASFGGISNDATAALADYSSTLYLSSTPSSVTGSWRLVTTAPSAANATTRNRIPIAPGTGNTGYQDFPPGFNPGSFNTPMPTSSASTAPTGKGWIVDGSGGVRFAAGTWTFKTTVKSGALPAGSSPVASLAVGLWIVTVASGSVSSPTLLVDPNCSAAPCSSGAAPGDTASGTNILTGASVTVSVPSDLPAVSLQSGQHLYVQLWRHETTPYVSGGSTNTIAMMTVNDGIASITHPAATVLPDTPALVSPADAVRTSNTTPQLQASYSEADANQATLTFQLCSDANCGTVLGSQTTANLSSGQTGSWQLGALADGKYYWRAQATDTAANSSGPSASRSFTVDTTPPGSPTLGSPAASARVNSAALSATFVDSDATDSGTVSFQVCTSNDGGLTCSSVKSSGTSAVVAAGALASATLPSPGADGTYYWQAKATDVAGNATGWTALRKFVLDTNPPAAPTIVAPADGASLGGGSVLTATISGLDTGDSGNINFRVCSDSACASVVKSGSSAAGLLNGNSGSWSLSGLADGADYWQAQAQDAAGNTSAWSPVTPRSFTYDGTPPVVAPTSPASGFNTNQIPALSATYSDNHGGSLTFQVCTTSACTAIAASTNVSGLATSTSPSWTPQIGDGTYFWRVQGTDSFGNASAWSAARSFRFDGTPPAVPVLQITDGVRVQPAPALNARLDDPGDDGDTMRAFVEICSDAACANVLASGYSASVTAGGTTGLQAPSAPDGTYYWRVFAEDAVGNQSSWSQTRSFVVDTVAPNVPDVVAPADGIVLNNVQLSAAFGSADPTDRGTVEFQLCADPDCTTVVATGSSWGVGPGAKATWATDKATLDDGTYFWRVRAVDEAGNGSDWSATRSLVLDQTPPGRPEDFHGARTGKTLTLRWRAPLDLAHVRGYALLADGRTLRKLKPSVRTVKIHLLRNDHRQFALASIDEAGNVSASTPAVPAGGQQLVLRKARATAIDRHRHRS